MYYTGNEPAEWAGWAPPGPGLGQYEGDAPEVRLGLDYDPVREWDPGRLTWGLPLVLIVAVLAYRGADLAGGYV